MGEGREDAIMLNPGVDREGLGGDLTSRLCHAIRSGGTALMCVPHLIKRILEDELWRELRLPQRSGIAPSDPYERRLWRDRGRVVRFGNFRDYITSSDGLLSTVTDVRKLIRDDTETLDRFDIETVGPAHLHRDPDNIRVTDAPSHGTGRQYALRKLRKSAPEIHARVLAGEMSPNRGMKLAGFRHDPSPMQLLERAWAKASDAERWEVLVKSTPGITETTQGDAAPLTRPELTLILARAIEGHFGVNGGLIERLARMALLAPEVGS